MDCQMILILIPRVILLIIIQHGKQVQKTGEEAIRETDTLDTFVDSRYF